MTNIAWDGMAISSDVSFFDSRILFRIFRIKAACDRDHVLKGNLI